MSFTRIEKLYFFTSTIVDWNTLLLEDKFKQVILDSLNHFSNAKCDIHAFVIMPNHIHLILSLCEGEKYEFQRDFLKFTSQQILKFMRVYMAEKIYLYKSKNKDRNHQIWKSKPFWVELHDEKQFHIKLNYIHNNPVSGKWKLSRTDLTYKWSSLRFYCGLKNDYLFLKHFEF